MACKICSSGNTTSLGGQTPHIYCHGCGGHEYEGLLIEKKDWEDWVNERVDTPRGSPANADVQPNRQSALPLV